MLRTILAMAAASTVAIIVYWVEMPLASQDTQPIGSFDLAALVEHGRPMVAAIKRCDPEGWGRFHDRPLGAAMRDLAAEHALMWPANYPATDAMDELTTAVCK